MLIGEGHHYCSSGISPFPSESSSLVGGVARSSGGGAVAAPAASTTTTASAPQQQPQQQQQQPQHHHPCLTPSLASSLHVGVPDCAMLEEAGHQDEVEAVAINLQQRFRADHIYVSSQLKSYVRTFIQERKGLLPAAYERRLPFWLLRASPGNFLSLLARRSRTLESEGHYYAGSHGRGPEKQGKKCLQKRVCTF